MADTLHNKIIRGTYGKLWIDGELLAEIKSFEGKATFNYETVNVQGELGEYQRYVGFSISGNILVHKVDTKLANKVADGARTGRMPEMKIVGRLADPDSAGAERIEFLNVTFDEMMLLQFENKKVQELSVPYKAADFNYLDKII